MGNLRFVPSPIPFRYNFVYSATANQSGRMQYHKIKPGQSKERISRTEFIDVFNNANILAVRPLQATSSPVFQLEFYI
ncbi:MULTISPECIES: hypothetical protein [Fulvivirga]|uniref:Uncharacterized protein n=1 Tax=Fulvivirga kasyanovii TaxID=396812 RepID=A0ABW9RY25_9BACT|nr:MULTISPECIES: hypothetical protein [Fulvivirga]MTI29159.1 hypothetical protein [Fulvivirga kasyanovii]UII31004.1 hypothetical protein LVD17_22180 [Fulvivirga ulvae]